LTSIIYLIESINALKMYRSIYLENRSSIHGFGSEP
jgi:hypothetical protein